MPRIDFAFGRRNQAIDQVVGLYTKTFAARNFNIGFCFVFFRQLIAKFGSAARRERNHLVRKVGVVVSLIVVSQTAQSFDDGVLRLGLAGVDDVVDLGYIAEMGMIFLTLGRRNPALVLVGIEKELAITEVAPEQPELPHVVRDILADVTHGAVRAHDNFLVFLGDVVISSAFDVFRVLRALCALCG